MSEKWLPNANHKRLEVMETNAQKRKNPRIKEKQNFTFIDSEKASWFFRHYSGKNKMGRDVVLLLREQGKLRERYDARIVRWVEEDSASYWVFEKGYRRTFQKDGSVDVVPITREVMQGRVATQPGDLINERQVADEMDSKMVRERIEVLKRSGEDTSVMETALYFKQSAHWMNLIVLLIGAALCHRFKRSGGLSQKFGVGLLLVFSYYILERIGLKMGENGALPPLLAAWISHILYGGLACVMLYRSFRL